MILIWFQGDSGGPLVAEDGKTIVGIVSGTLVKNCQTSDPKVFTNVFYFVNFIKRELEKDFSGNPFSCNHPCTYVRDS